MTEPLSEMKIRAIVPIGAEERVLRREAYEKFMQRDS